MISGYISLGKHSLTTSSSIFFQRIFIQNTRQVVRHHSRISSCVSTASTNTSTTTPSLNSLPTKHLSTNSASRIADMPPIAVDSWVAICDGDAAGLGHPREYIQLKKLNFREPSTCKYCGLRYLRKGIHDFAHAHE